MIAVGGSFQPVPLHGSLIPRASRALDARVTVWNSPGGAARAGGDWCDAFVTSDHTVALTIGDVSGHGEAVAGTMAVVRTAIMRALRDIHVPSSVLRIANNVAAGQGDGVIVTGIVAVVDHQQQTLTFANAGHPPPLLCTNHGHAFLENQSADLPLGLFPNHVAANYVVALPPDALVVFYTDGITEHARDPIAGASELVEAARRVQGRPELSAARAIAREVLKTGRGTDDAAIIGLRSTAAQRTTFA